MVRLNGPPPLSQLGSAENRDDDQRRGGTPLFYTLASSPSLRGRVGFFL